MRPTQPFPCASQRCHWYEKVSGDAPVHEPAVSVSLCPSRAEPEIAGSAVFTGAVPFAAIVGVGEVTAPVEPAEFLAVTDARIVRPTSSDRSR
jgi:hypothetical protein